jgi:hypothetical protein
MITHVVVFWTDQPQEAQRERLLAGVRALLPGIPGVREFRCGAPVPSPRGVVDGSYCVAIAMTFVGQAELDAYQKHPQHVRFIEEYLKPLCRRFVVYDFGG